MQKKTNELNDIQDWEFIVCTVRRIHIDKMNTTDIIMKVRELKIKTMKQ